MKEPFFGSNAKMFGIQLAIIIPLALFGGLVLKPFFLHVLDVIFP